MDGDADQRRFEAFMEEMADKYTHREDLRKELDQQALDEMREHVRELVCTMRKTAGISQAELARRMRVDQPFISALENGKRSPTLATLDRIARATGHKLNLNAVSRWDYSTEAIDGD